MMEASQRTINPKAILEDFQGLGRDIGTWPTLPRLALLFVIFFFVLLAGWWFVLSDELSALDAKHEEEIKLKEEYSSKKSQALNLDLYNQQLNEINRSFGALLKQLPNKSEVESLLVEINQAGMGRGLQFDLFKPGQEVMKEFYAELPIAVRLTGSYHDFGAFAGDIGRLSRIVTLNNISISANSQSKDSSLLFDATTKTFRYLDQEEVAKQKKAAQGAKK
ncbi:MAG: type 4a pilus biogenesis protein PilO [Pseudomonadota bacterium]